MKKHFIIFFCLLCTIMIWGIRCSEDGGVSRNNTVVEEDNDGDDDADDDGGEDEDDGPIPDYTAGVTYYGTNDYVEFVAGDTTCPIIITAGHGGYLKPDDIDDRSCDDCTTTADLYTQELATAIVDAVEDRIGVRPYLVLNKLARTKLDPNREIVEAALGNEDAELAYEEYHGFITDSKRIITDKIGKGLLLDIHGHGHTISRVEVGYLLKREQLNASDSYLDGVGTSTSVRAIIEETGVSTSEIIRGATSFGSYLYTGGYAAIPSASDPTPDTDPYFNGGYTTKIHGSVSSGTISAIQLECYRVGLRDTDENRTAFAEEMAYIIEEYLSVHYSITF